MMNVTGYVKANYGEEIEHCVNEELYYALLSMASRMVEEKKSNEGKKKLYHTSVEFLIGKLSSNNMVNPGIYEEVREELAAHGKDICVVEGAEPGPPPGNGSLGRLAACFLDSIATLGLNGDGIGLNHHLGLFKQEFENNPQKETKNLWIEKHSQLKCTEISYPVTFGNLTVHSRLYDIAVTEYHNQTNQPHLFDIETVDEDIVTDGISFDKEDIKKNLTLFLYPDDSDEKGQLLCIFQQYSVVSNGARYILDECVAKSCKLYDLSDCAVTQINDTHPPMVIPELIRLSMERGVELDDTIAIVSKTCAYTNHTTLAEALEKWPIAYLRKVVLQLVPIIRILNDKVRRKLDDTSLAIIDKSDRVHMTHIDTRYGFSVNGVVYLHTEILKENEFHGFYEIYPGKFNNKTNGITFHKWLLHCSRPLANLLEGMIGGDLKEGAMKLKILEKYRDDEMVPQKLLDIKMRNKEELKEYLKRTQGVEIDENSVYDIQIKRLHEYKRQQMSAFYVTRKYLEIKGGKLPVRPITVTFGVKAVSAHVIAKDITHLVLCLQELVNHDPEVSPYLKAVVIENYNMTQAEKLIPAYDISEQISPASKEVSGTGNMKFMLNGVVTLGTMDGANVEIAELVGKENIYIFGESSETVIEHYVKADYCSRDCYEEHGDIKEMVDFIVGPELMEIGQKENLERLYKELLSKGWFMTLLNYEDYVKTREQAYGDYEDRMAWAKRMLVNTSEVGHFSSDRTIAEYNRDIWKLK